MTLGPRGRDPMRDPEGLWRLVRRLEAWVLGGVAGGSHYSVVYQPGGTASENVYTDFNALYAASAAIKGGLRVVVDDSIVSPAVVPPKTGGGSYAFENWCFVGIPSYTSLSDGANLEFASGVTIATPTTVVFDQVSVTYAGTTPCISPLDNQQVNLWFINGAGCVCTTTGPFASGGGLGGFVSVTSFLARFGDGTHTVFHGVAGDMLIDLYDDGSLNVDATAADNQDDVVVYADASSVVLSQPGNVEVNLIDDASCVNYSPTTPGDWETAPTTSAAGLDELAAKGFNSDTNSAGVSGGASPQTVSDAAAYTPKAGAKAVVVTISFSGTVAGTTNAVTCQPKRGGSSLGVPVFSTPDSAGKFGGSITILDTTSPPSAATYGITLTDVGGTFTVAAHAVQFDKRDL